MSPLMRCNDWARFWPNRDSKTSSFRTILCASTHHYIDRPSWKKYRKPPWSSLWPHESYFARYKQIPIGWDQFRRNEYCPLLSAWQLHADRQLRLHHIVEVRPKPMPSEKDASPFWACVRWLNQAHTHHEHSQATFCFYRVCDIPPKPFPKVWLCEMYYWPCRHIQVLQE